MKVTSVFVVAVLGVVSACHSPETGNEDTTYADLVFVNGAIYTMNANRAWATTVAVRGDTITYVGNASGRETVTGPDTKVVDLAGKMMLPSFQDSHVHPIGSGREALTVDLNAGSTIEDYAATVREYADANPDVEWIVGGGWSMDVFGPGARASKKILDDIVPDRPVYLSSADGHSSWVNSKALEIAGIDADTQDPASGIVDRVADTGEIIGSLQEGAMELVSAHIPQPPPEFDEQALRYSVDLLNSYGITALNDASVSAVDLETYRRVDESGALTMRVVASQWWEQTAGLEQIETFKQQRQKYTRGNVNANSVKIMQDGVMENFTAVMSEPYYVDGYPSGIAMVEPEFLKEAVAALDAEGFQVHFHAIGDGAITQCLDAVEAAITKNGDSHRRHHISHLQAINPKDLARFRELGVVANFQPLWAFPDAYITDLTLPFIGEERGQWMYTIRSVVNAGGMIAFGSDWSVSTANPLPQIETAITRSDAEIGGEPLLPHESIDLPTALAAFTINAAYVNGLERQTGSIETGKLADLVVLDRNLFEIDASEISETKVVLTLFGGKAAYGSL